MDFFQAQESARSRSRLLLALFAAAVAAIIIAVYMAVHIIVAPEDGGRVDPRLLAIVALGTGMLIGGGSLFRTSQLSSGGSKVAEMLGGRRVHSGLLDEGEQRLVNVVEEMAIASGTPVPAIYILDGEEGVNAFAAGYTLDDAAVAVTRGAVDRLTRDELQGVIAHEFSHILNGDMRLNVRLIGVLFGILLLAVIGRGLLRTGGRGRRRDGSAYALLLGVALLLIGQIGVLFGRMIQAAVSRQREYLADAAAVQFTRDPSGLVGALEKIRQAGSRVENHHAVEVGHLFFANGTRSPLATLLATHPPLDDRIARLDPVERGRSRAAPAVSPMDVGAGPAVGASVRATAGASAAAAPASLGMPGAFAMASATGLPVTYAASTAIDAATAMAGVGSPRPEHAEYAARMIGSIPQPLMDAIHNPQDATAVLFALLYDAASPSAAIQRASIESHGGEMLRADVLRWHGEVQRLGSAARLPLLDLSVPALKELPAPERHRLHETASELIGADGVTDIFEMTLLHVLASRLQLGGAARPGRRKLGVRPLSSLTDEIETVLSAASWSGTDADAEASASFAAACALLPRLARPISLLRRVTVSVSGLDAALERLRYTAPDARRQLLHACGRAIESDGRISVDEGELLRAIGESLDCPIPPLVGIGAGAEAPQTEHA
jgi:Zn-dependent protease with chaperone function